MKDCNYDDIINLPPHKSKTRPKMSNHDRAAQFSPFAALTGHSAAINETARITSSKKELTEEEMYNISEKLRYITDSCDNQREIRMIYFIPDSKKDGGVYVESICEIAKIDEINRIITTSLSEIIPIDNIYSIDIL